jgi:sarcosine oxidase delta subunit
LIEVKTRSILLRLGQAPHCGWRAFMEHSPEPSDSFAVKKERDGSNDNFAYHFMRAGILGLWSRHRKGIDGCGRGLGAHARDF